MIWNVLELKSQSHLTRRALTNSKIFCPFVSVRMSFLSGPHAVKLRSVSGDIRFVRSYRLASFGPVQNFERTPPNKDVRWMKVTCTLVKQFVRRHLVVILYESVNVILKRFVKGQLQDM